MSNMCFRKMFTSEITFFLLAACLLLGLNCLEITRLSVPKFVKNGTEESVVLDCEYDYEVEIDKQLVVKWFHNDDPNPVYQWIPEFNIVQSSDKFADRVNTDYEVTHGTKFTKRRALNILRPTTELSGRYSCYVASLEGFDSEEQTMMVYAHPTNIYVNYTVTDEMVQVMCVVERVFPVPEIEMFQIGPGEVEPTPVDDVSLYHDLDDDAYNVILSTNLTEEELQTDTMRFFGCIVTIPGTSYQQEKRVPYIPAAKAEMVGADDDGDGASFLSPILLVICSLVLSQMMILAC